MAISFKSKKKEYVSYIWTYPYLLFELGTSPRSVEMFRSVAEEQVVLKAESVNSISQKWNSGIYCSNGQVKMVKEDTAVRVGKSEIRRNYKLPWICQFLSKIIKDCKGVNTMMPLTGNKEWEWKATRKSVPMD